MSERIKEQELLEKLHEKEDLQGINIRKDRKGKEGSIAVLSFGTEEPAQAAIGEVDKTEQYTAKKLTQTNLENMLRAESTKEQNMINQVVKLCYACKAEDDEIKDCKKRKNILLRYTDIRYTNTREIKEKMEQYGTVINIRNRKNEYEKHKKRAWYVLQQKQKLKKQ